MGQLQSGVAFVQGVAVTVVGQRGGVAQAVGARQVCGGFGGGVFVDVVAQEQHQVRLVGGQMAPGRVMPMLPALARGKRYPQRPWQVTNRRRGARAACGAHRVAQHEAVVVPARGLQSLQLYMHAVAQRGQRGGLALLYDLGKACVLRHLPPHGVGRQHLRRVGQQEPRPQHHAIRCRVAAGDAQCERVVLQRGWGAPGPAVEGGDGGSQGCIAQELPSLLGCQFSCPLRRAPCSETDATQTSGRRARAARPRWRRPPLGKGAEGDTGGR